MERCAFRGSGFFDVKYDYTNRAKKVLEKYGKEKITALTVSRIPLDAPIQRALEFVNKRATDSYDTFFHLGLIATLESGKKILIEKNQTIDLEESFTFPDTQLKRNVPLKGRVLQLGEFLDNTQSYMGKEKYFEYNAWNNNCQVYVNSLLTANNLNNPALKLFILQDLKQVIETTPYLAQKFANLITHTAGWVRKITGYGNEPIFYDDMEKSAFTNTHFRNVKYTTPDKHMQVVYMSIKPREDIPKEIHNDIDQFFRIENGKGKLLYGDELQHKRFLKPGEGFLIPKGTQHQIKNSSYDTDLKLYTIYSPANHPQGLIQK
jgi:mannose-6-phosphate isomerase-like protein (cupin superfamily)